MPRWEKGLRLGAWLAVLGGIVTLLIQPSRAPWWVGASLVLSVPVLGRAWRETQGTGLRPSVVWAFVALGWAILSQAAALSEPIEAGRPIAGHLTYLAIMATLAASISILNARSPGGGAWAILMVLLMVVFLIPWLEGAGLRRNWGGLARLRLENPWTIFYGLVVVAGVTNYVPTRFGKAAAVVALACWLEYLALAGWIVSPATRAVCWSAAPAALALAVQLADGAPVGPGRAMAVERLWLWFRDRWGVVWALRVQERFNRSAELQRWPFRLQWHGLTGIEPGNDAVPAEREALATLQGLLRRFAEVQVLEEASRPAGGEGRGCGRAGLE